MIQTITPDLLSGLPLPEIHGDGGKEARGRVLVIGGGRKNPGAAILSATAAYRAGAGKVQVAADKDFAFQLALVLIETLVIPVPANSDGEPSPAAASALASFAEKADAIVLGPGMIDEGSAADLAQAMIQASPPAALVLDAGALTGLAGRMEALEPMAGRLVLTPHLGEMAKLLGRTEDEVREDSDRVAIDAARAWSAVVALKGKVTSIASPDGRCWRHEGGSIGLGVAGSGDVLAGAIAGLLARGASPEVAAVWGVYAHGAAGRALSARIGKLGFLAREVADELPHHLDA